MSEDIFKERDSNLLLLGFSSYAEYLKSDLWAWIRTQVLLSEEKYCVCCRSTTGLSLHHRQYDLPILVGNFPNSGPTRNIVRLCSDCHYVIHTDGTTWFPMEVVDLRFRALARKERLPTCVPEFNPQWL